jgi:hypothetical protein
MKGTFRRHGEDEKCTRTFGRKNVWKINGYLRSVLSTRYHSGDEIKQTEMGRTCSTYGERKRAYRVLVGKPE